MDLWSLGSEDKYNDWGYNYSFWRSTSTGTRGLLVLLVEVIVWPIMAMKTKPTFIWVVEHRQRDPRYEHVLMQLCSTRKRALGYIRRTGPQETKGYFALTREELNGESLSWDILLAFYDLKGKRLKEQPI